MLNLERRMKFLRAFILALLAASPAARAFCPGPGALCRPIAVAVSQTVASVSIPCGTSCSFTGGTSATIGAIAVTMSPASPPFTGTLALSGTSASSFALSSTTLPSNLTTNGSLIAGTYTVAITATQTGAGSASTGTITVTGTTGGAPTGTCAASTAFFARVWALPATLDGTVGGTGHVAAYDTLICGLASDLGSATLAPLDALYIWATNTVTGTNTAVANLNLVGNTCTIVAHGPPAFTADQGYIGVEGSTAIYLDTQCDPTTDGGHYAATSANVSLWNLTGASTSGSYSFGNYDGTHVEAIIAYTSGNVLECFIANNFTGTSNTTPDSYGSLVCDRTAGSGNLTPYWHGGAYTPGGGAPGTISSRTFYFLNLNNQGAANGGVPYRFAQGSFGGHLTAAQISSTGTDVATGTGLVNRVCAYLTAVRGSC